MWYVAAVHDIQLEYVHVLGANNRVADLLSGWAYSLHNMQELQALVGDPVWMPVDITYMDLDNTI